MPWHPIYIAHASQEIHAVVLKVLLNCHFKMDVFLHHGLPLSLNFVHIAVNPVFPAHWDNDEFVMHMGDTFSTFTPDVIFFTKKKKTSLFMQNPALFSLPLCSVWWTDLFSRKALTNWYSGKGKGWGLIEVTRWLNTGAFLFMPKDITFSDGKKKIRSSKKCFAFLIIIKYS